MVAGGPVANFSRSDSLTVRTVECNSYRVTQTRATRSPRPGTETGGRDDHVVDCDREPGDARVRRSYQEPLRRNVERRSQELALFNAKLEKYSREASFRSNLARLRQAAETLRLDASVDIPRLPRSLRQ